MTPPEDIDALISRLRARGPGFELHREGPPPNPASPLTDRQLASAVKALGFHPPQVLVDVYRAIGNGGFGPGYGLMGLGPDGATDDMGHSADTLYAANRAEIPQTPGKIWPRELLPIAHFGCAIYHCVACGTGRIVVFEPNYWDDSEAFETALFPTRLTLFQWLSRWAAGEPLIRLLTFDERDRANLRPMAEPAVHRSARVVGPRQTSFLDDI